MRSILSFTFLACSASFSLAQQGSWYVGGQVGFGTSKTTDFTNNNQISKTTIGNISPEIGFFLKDDIALGFALNFSSQKENNNDANSDYDKLGLFSPVLYARKFWSVEDIFSVFVGIDLNFSGGNYKEKRNNAVTTVNKVSGFGTNLNVGLAFPLGSKFTAVGKYGLLGYSTLTVKDDNGNKEFTTNQFGLNANSLGSVFNVGLYYTFLSKQQN